MHGTWSARSPSNQIWRFFSPSFWYVPKDDDERKEARDVDESYNPFYQRQFPKENGVSEDTKG